MLPKDSDGFYILEPTKYTVQQQMKRKKEQEIIFRHGHIAITNYHLGDCKAFEKMLSTWDDIYFKYRPMGYWYIKRLRELRINRGFNIKLLHEYFPNAKMTAENDAYPSDKIDIRLTVNPRSDFQRVALTFMTANGDFKENRSFTQQIIDAEPGEGKAQPDDTMIPVPGGWKRMNELKVGDEVYNRMGKPVKILNIYPQNGIQETYRVTLKDGRSTRCNLQHLWAVYSTRDIKHMEVLPLYKILEYQKEYKITFYVPDCITPDDKKYGVTEITNIEKVEPTYQRCILIDDPEHIYLTEDYIPTHNTFCGVATVSYFQRKAIVIVPIQKVLEQWKESFINFTTLKDEDILVVQGSNICKKIIDGKYKDKKVFLFMADTLSSFESRYGTLETIELMRATHAALKIVDEVHLDMKAISMIEAVSNFQMNYYMSATPGRAQRKENFIFRTQFYYVPRFGSDFKKQEERHVIVMTKFYKFLPDQSQINKMINKRQKWLNSKAYETELFNAPIHQRANFEASFTYVLRWAKKQLKPGNKILVLCSTIDGTKYLKDLCSAEVFSKSDVSQYYGSLPTEADKKSALEKTVICATSASLGTGADVKGLQFVFCCITYTAWTNVIQMSGRLRKLPDNTPCVYIEFVNESWYKTLKQYDKRKPYLMQRSKTGKILEIE